MSCFAGIMSDVPPEIHTVEKCDFLTPISHPQIIYFFVKYLFL